MKILARRINGRLSVDWTFLTIAAVTMCVCLGIISVGSTDGLKNDAARSFLLILCFVWTVAGGWFVAITVDKARELDKEPDKERLP